MFRPHAAPLSRIEPAQAGGWRLAPWIVAVAVAAAFALGVWAQASLGLLPAGRFEGHAAPGPQADARDPGDAVPAGLPQIGSAQAWRGQVLRVVDGDTVEARIQTWPGQEVVTLVRLRGIDTPELAGACPQEKMRAEEARDALVALVGAGSIVVSEVGPDKFYGRVVARVATPDGRDVGQTLLDRGLARIHVRGQRGSWCQSSAPGAKG